MGSVDEPGNLKTFAAHLHAHREKPMKEKTPRRTSKAVREKASEELGELLPLIETAAAEPEEKEAAMKTVTNKARVEKALTLTVERVTRDISELQLSIGKVLTDLSQQLGTESAKLADLRLAIETETARLKELHDIDAGMVSLKAILEVAAERRAELEAELSESEASLKLAKERAAAEWAQEQKEHEAATKKEREREEDEYSYKLSVKRRKEADDYSAKQASVQKSLEEQHQQADREYEERERALAAREQEIKDLRAQVERFPRELAAAAKQVEQETRAEVQKQAQIEAKLQKMEFDAERNVASLKIAGLEETIKRQASQLDTLAKQVSVAQGQVQAMALKAIEGAATMKSMPAPQGKAE